MGLPFGEFSFQGGAVSRGAFVGLVGPQIHTPYGSVLWSLKERVRSGCRGMPGSASGLPDQPFVTGRV